MVADLQAQMESGELSAHRITELYLERIEHFRENPPDEDWDGVFTFQTK